MARKFTVELTEAQLEALIHACALYETELAEGIGGPPGRHRALLAAWGKLADLRPMRVVDFGGDHDGKR